MFLKSGVKWTADGISGSIPFFPLLLLVLDNLVSVNYEIPAQSISLTITEQLLGWEVGVVAASSQEGQGPLAGISFPVCTEVWCGVSM